MTVMFVVLAAWVVLSVVVGLTVGRAIRQADSAEFPSRRAHWSVDPAASVQAGSAEADGGPSTGAASASADAAAPVDPQHASHAA